MINSIPGNLLRANPIVITGTGCFSAGGGSVEATWNAAVAGRPGSKAFQNDVFGQPLFACSAPETNPSDPAMHPVRKMDRSAQMAWLAARQAWREAGLDQFADSERIGIVIGSSRGPFGKIQDSFASAEQRHFLPSLGADSTFAAASGALAQAFKIKGPGLTVSATCASAAFGIAFAAEQILLGRADVMLAGGTEAPLHPVIFRQLQSAGVLGSHENPALACRPFDASRNGLVLGEGSAFLVLESAQSAARRGVPVLARLAGWSTSLDNSGRTGVDECGSGMVQVMREALKVAALTPDKLNYINAHGTGTPMNDQAEARAVETLLGDRVMKVACTSTKPVTGHCLGATPAMEAVLCVEALRNQIIPPTATCVNQDPLCLIRNPSVAEPGELNYAMSNSLGFWGYHASLIFSRV